MLNTNRELQDPSAKFVQHSKYRHICLILSSWQTVGQIYRLFKHHFIIPRLLFWTATKLGNNLWNDKKRKTNYHFLYLKTKLLLRLYNENFLQEIPSFNIKKKPRLHSQIYTELWPLPWFTTCISQWSHNHQWKKGWALKSAYSYIHNTLQCVAFIYLAHAYNTLLFFEEIDIKETLLNKLSTWNISFYTGTLWTLN